MLWQMAAMVRSQFWEGPLIGRLSSWVLALSLLYWLGYGIEAWKGTPTPYEPPTLSSGSDWRNSTTRYWAMPHKSSNLNKIEPIMKHDFGISNDSLRSSTKQGG